MREILFRAKRLDNSEWVEGLLWKKKYNSNKLFISCFPNEDDDEECFVVDSETVCQYIGLIDKNGQKIFEGDILYGEFYGYLLPCNETFKIYWDEGEKGFKANYFNESKCEVIGNIFDNLELLKGGGIDD